MTPCAEGVKGTLGAIPLGGHHPDKPASYRLFLGATPWHAPRRPTLAGLRHVRPCYGATKILQCSHNPEDAWAAQDHFRHGLRDPPLPFDCCRFQFYQVVALNPFLTR
jgi:hypothetical protein